MPITIRTGDIVRADQGKKLYKIVYSLSPYLEDYAVPINGLHTLPDTSGITYCESFSIGDHVIYLCPDSDTYMTNRVGWIIGRVPKEDDSSVKERRGKGALRKLFHPLCVGQRDSEA